MQHTRVILRFLLPTNQNATVSIHPTVCPFSHPAASLEPRGTPDQLRLLTARANMCREPEFPREATDFVIVIPFVQAQVLRPVPRRPRSFHGNVLDRLPRTFEVVDVRARHGQSHRNTVRLGEQTSLGAGFGSIRRIRASFSPARAGLCSHAPATTAPQTPNTHPNTAIDSIASLHPPFRASMPERVIDNPRVFGIGS